MSVTARCLINQFLKEKSSVCPNRAASRVSQAGLPIPVWVRAVGAGKLLGLGTRCGAPRIPRGRAWSWMCQANGREPGNRDPGRWDCCVGQPVCRRSERSWEPISRSQPPLRARCDSADPAGSAGGGGPVRGAWELPGCAAAVWAHPASGAQLLPAQPLLPLSLSHLLPPSHPPPPGRRGSPSPHRPVSTQSGG